jgi:ribosomal-protein-alanine N-acetyltransferase
MIETSRLRLRQGLERDVEGLVAALNDWTVAQWLIRPPFPYSAEDARRFIQWTRAEDGVFGGRYVIADRQSDALLGVVSLEPADDRAELGYWLRPAAQGRGYMKEAVAALLHEAAWTPGNVSTAFATTDPDNFASQAVLRGVGFSKSAERVRTVTNRRNSTILLLYEAPLNAYR